MQSSRMTQQPGEEEIEDGVRASLKQAVEFSMNCQQPDGHWVAPVS